jgi:capsular polysaccharide biosynthesis protein
LDLALYTSLLARHRRLVIVGVVASLALAVLSFVRVSPSGIGYRSSERWVNEATLVVTQAGFNEGRSGGGAAVDTTLQRFSTLVNVYAALVESDQVVNLLVKRGLVDREDVSNGEIPVVATPVVSDNGASTPLMTITGSASSAAKATALTVGATRAFIDTLERRQRAAGIPSSQRTLVQPVRRFGEPTLVEPRSKSLPIIAFLAGLSATFGAVIIRDGRLRRQGEEPEEAELAESVPLVPAREQSRSVPSKRPAAASSKRRRRRPTKAIPTTPVDDTTAVLTALDSEEPTARPDGDDGSTAGSRWEPQSTASTQRANQS